jgi:hypothetical protein
MTTTTDRLQNSFGRMSAAAIDIPLDVLGAHIMRLIGDVGKLHYVSPGDLNVFGANAATPPTSVENAMRFGSKLFDAVYYFACEVTDRPAVKVGQDLGAGLPAEILMAKKRLLWTAIFLMLRGSYPSSTGAQLGSDVPAFLVNIAGMQDSPAVVAAGLASFNLQNIPTGWIRFIDWSAFAPEIKQRLALGLAGYRMLGPFKIYNVRDDATPEVIAAVNWVKQISSQRPDYDILSATRSSALIARLGSWNKSLGNLILLAFTPAQITEMVANKILFQIPVRDPRADTWRTWATGVQIALTNPIVFERPVNTTI